MVDPTDKDTKHIKDQSTGREGYLEYTKEKEKGKVNQLDVRNEKDQHNRGNYNPRTNKNSKNKTRWPTIRASDKNHSPLRTSDKNQMTNFVLLLLFTCS